MAAKGKLLHLPTPKTSPVPRYTLAERYAWLVEARDNLVAVFGLTSANAPLTGVAFLAEVNAARQRLDAHLELLGVEVAGADVGAVTREQADAMDATDMFGPGGATEKGAYTYLRDYRIGPKSKAAYQGAKAAAAASAKWGAKAAGKLVDAGRGALRLLGRAGKTAWGAALLAGKWLFSEAGIIRKAFHLAVAAVIFAVTAKHVLGIDPAHPMGSQWFYIVLVIGGLVVFSKLKGGRSWRSS